MAAELIDLRARIAELEAAQRPPLGYVAITVPEAPWDHSPVTRDRSRAERDLADLAESYPRGAWRLGEIREVQP
jgi:hypothetical protein